MNIISLRSLPALAKVWFDMGSESWSELLRVALAQRKPLSSTKGNNREVASGWAQGRNQVGAYHNTDHRDQNLPLESFLFHGEEPEGNGASGWSSIGSGCEPWRSKLTDVSSQLRHITASTEEEFLAIGEHLLNFQQRAGEITFIISGLVSQLGGEKGAVAIRGLADMLDTLQHYLDNAQNQCGRQSLAEILNRLQKVDTPLNSFGQMDRSLKMFSTYTKIESARLGARSEGFESLAKDVARLSSAVSGKACAVFLRKNELTAAIQEALATIVSMEAEQQAKILSILKKTNQSLEALAEIVDRSVSTAGEIAASATEVTENLGQVVFSLQAHDAVRQQIQHVAEALDELTAPLPRSSAFQHPDSEETNHLLVETGTLCQIQSAQLSHSSDEFLKAVESIIVNLQEIAVKETGMANGTRELLGMTDQTGASFFLEMGEDLGEVAGMLTTTVATNRKLSEVMIMAADTVGGIYGFVADIETIAYDIKLVALNFLIQAAQLGSEGGGLGVMAEAINRLSDDARDQAADVAVMLTEIKKVADGMCQGTMAEASVMEAEIKEMRQELEKMLATLRQMNEDMPQGLTRANVMVRELSTGIDQVTAGITVHHRVAAALDEAKVVLDGIYTEAKAMALETGWSSATEKLQSADKRYTMHSERDVHAAVVNDQPSLAAASQRALEGPMLLATAGSPEAGSASDGPDLGDNVELF